MTDLAGQVAIVTGASSGIGQVIAEALAARGMRLVLAARRHDKLEALAKILKDRHPALEVRVSPTDVSMAAQVENLVRHTVEAFGRIDVLINNAGVASKIALLQEIPLEEIDRTIDINLKGPIYLMRAALPYMVRQQGGVIVNINSVAGKTAFPYWSVYDASKFGLHAITAAVAEEQRQNNIKVIGIYPGAVDTPIWNTIELNHEPEREGMLDPETIAEAVLYALDQPAKVLVSDITLSPLKPAL